MKYYTIRKIREARLQNNISRSTLGYLIGRNEEYVKSFEQGKQSFGILNVLKFCEVLKINPVDFYSDF